MSTPTYPAAPACRTYTALNYCATLLDYICYFATFTIVLHLLHLLNSLLLATFTIIIDVQLYPAAPACRTYTALNNRATLLDYIGYFATFTVVLHLLHFLNSLLLATFTIVIDVQLYPAAPATPSLHCVHLCYIYHCVTDTAQCRLKTPCAVQIALKRNSLHSAYGAYGVHIFAFLF